jgi:hypothetical protein
MQIRKAQASDGPAILEIILPVIREGATYSLDPDLSAADALAYWTSPDKETFVTEGDNVIVGTYFIRRIRRAAAGTFVIADTSRAPMLPDAAWRAACVNTR